MSELLPTPTAGDGKAAWNRTSGRSNPDSQHHDGVTLTDALRTSASSQGSAGWISRWKRTGIPASDRSSGTSTAEASSSDGGRLFPVGEMSPGSRLLPTPSANQYENQDAETIEARRAVQMAKHRNGNGFGLTTAMALTVLTSSSEDSPANPPPLPADAEAPPTSAGSGPSSPVSLGSWDPELSSWRTSQVSLLSTEDERFPRSSERWPTSGMTRRGRAFALPMSERATDGNGSGSSLPTPTTQDGANTGGPSQYERNSLSLSALLHTPNLAAQVDELLPTPRSRLEGNDVAKLRDDGSWHGNLEEHLGGLLASPTAWLGRREAHSKGDPKRWTNPERSNDLSDQIAFLSSDGDPTFPSSDDGSES